MNDEKKIARAIIDAQAMREGSYVPNWEKVDEDLEKIRMDFGEYKLDLQECLIICCKKHGLSDNLWCLLSLAMHWWNDIQLWAEDVLAGKNILDECKKENAKMIDDYGDSIKQCPSGVANKDVPCCDLASKDACEQCQETGNTKHDSAGKANPQNYC